MHVAYLCRPTYVYVYILVDLTENFSTHADPYVWFCLHKFYYSNLHKIGMISAFVPRVMPFVIDNTNARYLILYFSKG